MSCSIEVDEVTVDPTPPVPGTGDVSVTVNSNYGVDPDGNGVHDFVIHGPAIIVGRDANGTGIPDLWEGFVMNGLAWQIP